MIEYQGWATIREAYCEEDEDGATLAVIASELKARIGELTGRASCEATFRNINGVLRLSVMGYRNHASGDWPDVVALFEWIAANARGSYGILSCHDDEDAEGRDNDVQVFVLRRGNLTRSFDPHLSPYFPMVEDPPLGSPYFNETLDQAFIREIVRPMGMRDLGKGLYALDLLRDYRMEVQVGKVSAFEGEEPEVSVYLTLHCPRYGQVMDLLNAQHPGMTWEMSGFRKKGSWGDVLRLGQVTFYRHDGRFHVTSFKDHLGNLRRERFDVRAHFEHLMAIDRPEAFREDYAFGLSRQILATLDRFWPHIFLCIDCGMSPAEVMDQFDDPDFAQTKKAWRLKAPLDTAHVKDMMDVFVPWNPPVIDPRV
jgi:hypothetical protein